MAPRDPYNKRRFWPEGFGNLDNAGRQRMFKLGEFIRRRYDEFLTDNSREIYSRSSDVDRCIESAQALLAGLYPPNCMNDWNPNIRWTPVPVHTVPPPDDYLLNEAGRKYLDEYIKEIEIIQESKEVKELYAESAHERQILESNFGLEFDIFTKFKCAFSTLDIEQRQGFPMPIWFTPEFKQKLYRYAGKAFQLAASGTEKLKKIRSQHLLADIIERMDLVTITDPVPVDKNEYEPPTSVTNHNKMDYRFVQYSTHDSVVTILLEALQINGPMPYPPGFGATVFLELWAEVDPMDNPMSEKYIKIYYLDDTDIEEPIEKRLPDSVERDEQGRVTFEAFKKFVQHLLPDAPP